MKELISHPYKPLQEYVSWYVLFISGHRIILTQMFIKKKACVLIGK